MFPSSRSVQQVAALPFVLGEEGFAVLLVTARRKEKARGRRNPRWVLPKGWPKRRETLTESAMREAREEAGVTGVVHPMPVGEYRYRKSMKKGYDVDSHVFVFALHVRDEHETWREEKLRERRWMSLDAAAGALDDRGAARLVTGLSDGDTLHSILAALAAEPDGHPVRSTA